MITAYPINMPLCASTGPVLVQCCQHQTSTGPVLATNDMILHTIYTNSNVSSITDTSYHRCELTCRCGYFHEIVYDVRACNLCDVVKTEQWRQLIFASRIKQSHWC